MSRKGRNILAGTDSWRFLLRLRMTQSCQINLFSSDCSLPPEELGREGVIGNAQQVQDHAEDSMQRLLQVLERSGEVRARQQNQTVLVPSLLSVQLIHPTQVQTHQLSPSTTVKNGSCHPIQTFQQRGQVSRGPCCAAMRAVCHCSCSTYTAALPC